MPSIVKIYSKGEGQRSLETVKQQLPSFAAGREVSNTHHDSVSSWWIMGDANEDEKIKLYFKSALEEIVCVFSTEDNVKK